MGNSTLNIDNLKKYSRTKLWIVCLVCSILAVIILANMHLVYVAVTSQPDCVPHLKEIGSGGTFRAAQSSC